MVPPYSDRISRVPPYLFQPYFHSWIFAYGAITHYGQTFQTVPLIQKLKVAGSSDFARHYFRNLGWFLFLRLLRCFSSPGSLYLTYVFSQEWPLRVGFPHSDIYGSKLYCQLPVAFRRLTRLSSPVIAKASTTCTYSLDPITLNPQLFKDEDSCYKIFLRLWPLPSDLNGYGLIQSKPMFFMHAH